MAGMHGAHIVCCCGSANLALHLRYFRFKFISPDSDEEFNIVVKSALLN